MKPIEDRQVQRWINQVAEENPEAQVIDDHDNAIIGIAKFKGEPFLAYSKTRIIVNLVTRDKMTIREASEYFNECLLDPFNAVVVCD